jgi:hypothetical protein
LLALAFLVLFFVNGRVRWPWVLMWAVLFVLIMVVTGVI